MAGGHEAESLPTRNVRDEKSAEPPNAAGVKRRFPDAVPALMFVGINFPHENVSREVSFHPRQLEEPHSIRGSSRQCHRHERLHGTDCANGDQAGTKKDLAEV